MPYSLVQSSVYPPTEDSVAAFFIAHNTERTFNVRISVHNETTGDTLLDSTVVAVNQYLDGTVFDTSLTPSTSYSIRMIIRRASTYEYLGDRTISISTTAAPVTTVTVPNVVGQTETAATTALTNAGFTVSPTYSFIEEAGYFNGEVMSQDPAGNTEAASGSSVSITVYSYSPPPPAAVWSSKSNFFNGKVSVPYSASRYADDATSITGISINAPGLTATAGVVDGKQALIIQGTPTTAGTYTVSATANGDGGNDSLSVSLVISPLTPPAWSDISLSNDFRVGQSYAVTSGGNNSLSATNSATFSLTSGSLPAGIVGTRSLSGSTAFYTLTGNPTVRGPYSFTVRASNDDGIASPNYTFSGSVTHPPLWIDEALAGFNQGRVYSDSISVSTSTPVTWTLSAGALPPGITSATSGLNTNIITLSGTPTGTGSYTFTLSANNGDGVLSKTFSGNILLPPSWVDNTLGSFIEGVSYSDSVSATNGATFAVTGTLPSGITHSNGLFSGTPTTLNQAYNFTVTASNADGSITQNFTGTVQPDLGGGIKLYSGTAWDNKEIYAYNGTTWVKGTVHMFNGSIWAKSVF